MCKESTKLKFCTCNTDEDIKVDDPIYKWSLSRLVNIDETLEILGSIIPPVTGLDNNVTVANVLKLINEENVFDFDYDPVADDTITIYSDTSEFGYQYFSIIYKNGIWQKGNNPVFKSKKILLDKGHIKIVD